MEPDAKDIELSRGSIDAYLLEDGRVLLVSIDWNDADDQDLIGALWVSKAALLSSEVKTAGPTHILKGLLPQGQYFVDAVPALIDELALHMQLPRSFFFITVRKAFWSLTV